MTLLIENCLMSVHKEQIILLRRAKNLLLPYYFYR